MVRLTIWRTEGWLPHPFNLFRFGNKMSLNDLIFKRARHYIEQDGRFLPRTTSVLETDWDLKRCKWTFHRESPKRINILNFPKKDTLYSQKSSIIAPLYTEAYLGACQASMMKLFAEIVKGF